MTVQNLHLEALPSLEGTTFTVIRTGAPGALDQEIAPVELELMSVEDRAREAVVSSSLLFRGPRDQALQQGTYRLKHESIGTTDLFLVPILDPQPRDERMCYQAIISRLREF